MMLLYGVLRGITASLRMLAEWSHRRAQNAYEQREVEFSNFEASCKAHEVSMGRPVDYSDQLRLLKSYERREATRDRWVRSAERMYARQRVDDRVKAFSAARLPYTFGLIDMAFVMRILDEFGLLPALDWPSFEPIVRTWL